MAVHAAAAVIGGGSEGEWDCFVLGEAMDVYVVNEYFYFGAEIVETGEVVTEKLYLMGDKPLVEINTLARV